MLELSSSEWRASFLMPLYFQRHGTRGGDVIEASACSGAHCASCSTVLHHTAGVHPTGDEFPPSGLEMGIVLLDLQIVLVLHSNRAWMNGNLGYLTIRLEEM